MKGILKISLLVIAITSFSSLISDAGDNCIVAKEWATAFAQGAKNITMDGIHALSGVLCDGSCQIYQLTDRHDPLKTNPTCKELTEALNNKKQNQTPTPKASVVTQAPKPTSVPVSASKNDNKQVSPSSAPTAQPKQQTLDVALWNGIQAAGNGTARTISGTSRWLRNAYNTCTWQNAEDTYKQMTLENVQEHGFDVMGRIVVAGLLLYGLYKGCKYFFGSRTPTVTVTTTTVTTNTETVTSANSGRNQAKNTIASQNNNEASQATTTTTVATPSKKVVKTVQKRSPQWPYNPIASVNNQ